MTDRTFKQHALAFGTTPTEVVYQINGNTVFNGPVTTVDQPVPPLPNTVYKVDNIAWTWTNDATFDGTQSISIAVTGSTLLLAQSTANNPAGNAEIFGSFYTVEVDGVTYSDPFTEETIDGVALLGPYDPAFPSQWWWRIPSGSTFTATMHVTPPPPIPPPPLLLWNIANAYLARDRVVTENDALYLALLAVPIGVDITDESYWLLRPQLEWTPSISYASGYFVRYPLSGPLYKSLQAVPEGIEITDAAYWQEWTFGD